MTATINHIFRDYDIRGIVGDELTPRVVELIGRAIGSEVRARGLDSIMVARDGRTHSQEIERQLVCGITSAGCDVCLIGAVPTPVLYFGTATSIRSGVMITGSHNPANYNGFKLVVDGEVVSGITLLQRIHSWELDFGFARVLTDDVATKYIDSIKADIKLNRPIKIVVDAGNGIAGNFAELFTAIGCDVIPLFCEVDGTFPNHHPDPSKAENLTDLAAAVLKHNADVGVAFDGDGDRIGAVTNSGAIIPADRLMMLFIKDILSANTSPSNVVYDVKCTRLLKSVIESAGGVPIMSKTGHLHIKKAIRKTAAVFAGELSGHLFFNDRWFGFDDALYAAARLVELVSNSSNTLDDMMAALPAAMETSEVTIEISDTEKFQVIKTLSENASSEFPNNSSMLDGVSLEFENKWGVIRASNTTPCLVGRFEGVTLQELVDIKETFNRLLKNVNVQIAL